MANEPIIQDLRTLSIPVENLAVSIYMPTVRTGREVRQNGIRLKNLLKEAGARMHHFGLDERYIDARLQPAWDFVGAYDWTQNQNDGLALLLTETDLSEYRLPVTFAEAVQVGRYCYLRPLLETIQDNGDYYVLSVSQQAVHLYRGHKFALLEYQLEDLPTDLKSALNYEQYISTMQQHATGARVVPGNVQFHGQGSTDPDAKKKDELQQFFHRINDALTAFLRTDELPLVFVGVDYLFPLFQEVCSYPHLWPTPVTGNPTGWPAEQLHAATLAVVEPWLKKQRQEALAKYQSAVGSAYSTTNIKDIILGTVQGAIETLLLRHNAEQWGRVDEEIGAVEPAHENEMRALEVYNYALVKTLATGGMAYIFDESDMPSGHDAAAILRFPIQPLTP